MDWIAIITHILGSKKTILINQQRMIIHPTMGIRHNGYIKTCRLTKSPNMDMFESSLPGTPGTHENSLSHNIHGVVCVCISEHL